MRRRFVVQRHELPSGEVHFDWMVERSPGGPLVTFQLEAPPPSSGKRSFDHRAVYLDYEGEVSGGRGRVKIVSRGEVEDVSGTPDAPLWSLRTSEGVLEVATGEGGRVTVRPTWERPSGAASRAGPG